MIVCWEDKRIHLAGCQCIDSILIEKLPVMQGLGLESMLWLSVVVGSMVLIRRSSKVSGSKLRRRKVPMFFVLYELRQGGIELIRKHKDFK